MVEPAAKQFSDKGVSSVKKGLLLTCCLVLVGVAFIAGRASAPAPRFQPEVHHEDPLANAFEQFIQAQRDALALYQSREFFAHPQGKAEAYRGLLYAMIGSIKAGALQSHDFPRVMRAVDWTSKSGLDNPDNNYYVALLDDTGTYRLSGNRGTTEQLIFQLVIGQPGVGKAGTSTNVSVLYDSDLRTDPEGNFDIIISPERPPDADNWMLNAPGAESLLVRFTHVDWGTEADSPLYIERLDRPRQFPAPLDEPSMVRGLERAAEALHDKTASWLALAERMQTLVPTNSLHTLRMTPGGLKGQYSAFGNWDLQPDEALLIEFDHSGAPYMGIQLGSPWFVSLDYENHTSTLNQHQLNCPEGGSDCYAVIAGFDPGVANWLDTAGHPEGVIFIRWQGLSEAPSEGAQPRTRLLDAEALASFQASHPPLLTAAERQANIAKRRRAVHQRFGG